ncbi:hypothetical protein MAR_035805 [Mya arenaria]|uniref:Uncharacterized protein n=1 Tax=Mya arenaria TaxID=6604 RepID=A0ABY7EQP9_MYAAR|nr:hypothetical protein MAR_035805 [Mya arenaria]
MASDRSSCAPLNVVAIEICSLKTTRYCLQPKLTFVNGDDGSVLKTHHRVSAIGFFSIDQYEETSHAKYLI